MGDNPITSRADIPDEKSTGQEECWLQRAVYAVWNFFTGDKDKEKTTEVPPGVGKDESRNVEGVIDNQFNHLYAAGYSVHYDPENNFRIKSVQDPDKHDVRRFVYNERGLLREVTLPNGSYVTQDGISWNFKDLYGYVSPTTMEYLQVDRYGNVSFDNPAIGARVTLAVDEHTMINYWHRGDWQNRHPYSHVEKNDDNTVRAVVDVEGRVLRDFAYNNGRLSKISNMDRTSWSTRDGGKTWIFTESNGKEVEYPDLDIKVDQLGNVGYTIGDRKIVELAGGVNMIGPPAEWDRRWIDQLTLSSAFSKAA